MQNIARDTHAALFHASCFLKFGRYLKHTAILAGRTSNTHQPLPATSDETQTPGHTTPIHSYPSTCTPHLRAQSTEHLIEQQYGMGTHAVGSDE